MTIRSVDGPEINVLALSMRRTQRSLAPLEQLDATPHAVLTDYPAIRTLSPLPTDFLGAPNLASKAATDTDAGAQMIARLNRHTAARSTTDIAPFGVARRPRRRATVPALGVLAAVAIAAATLLHKDRGADTTDVDPDAAPMAAADMAHLELTEARQVTHPDVAGSRAALSIGLLPDPPHQIMPVEPSVEVAAPAVEAAKDAVKVPRPIATVTVTSPAPQPIKPAPPSSQPTALTEVAQTKEAASVRDREASSVDDGYRLFKAGAVDDARAVFLRAASRGNVDAAFALGVTYDPKSLADAKISGVTPDPEKAVYWYRHAHRMAKDARQRPPSRR